MDGEGFAFITNSLRAFVDDFSELFEINNQWIASKQKLKCSGLLGHNVLVLLLCRRHQVMECNFGFSLLVPHLPLIPRRA